MERAIIHLNVADFAVAVERTLDPRLRTRAVIIAPEGESRAVVYDMSEEAYQSGVRKGMPLARALRACRGASVLAPHPDRYERAMQALLACALPFSPRVESTDVQGHLFVDATGTERLFGSPLDVAWRIRKAARAQLNLNPIWTVAANKLVAKVASRVVKPDGECLVESGDEPGFLSPLPLQLLPGLEPGDLPQLREYRLTRFADVARWTVEQLAVIFGTRARPLRESVLGIDPSPVLPAGARPPQILLDHAFGQDTNDAQAVRAALSGLAENAGRALREQRLTAARLGLALDYSDGVRTVRQASAPQPTANDFTLFELACRVLDLAWTRRVRLRHLRLACSGLCFPPAQLELFETPDPGAQRRDRLVEALDRIRSRFGAQAVYLGRGLSLGHP